MLQNALSIKHALDKSYMVENWYGLNGFFNLFFQNFKVAWPELPKGIHILYVFIFLE